MHSTAGIELQQHPPAEHETATAGSAAEMARPERARRVPLEPIALLVAVACIVALWFSAADHPLYTPDEGRYGVVGLHMAEGGSWLVPVFEGEPHITKPPLTYWGIAVGIEIFGRSELAVRFISLLAGSGVVLLTLALTWRVAGPRVTALSIGTLSLMPLFIITSRFATTDALLDFFWLAALVCGYRTIADDRRSIWPWLMWTAVAGGLMTKGPLGLAPVGIVMTWLALAGRWRDILHLRLARGMLIAVAPILLWVALIIVRTPDAIAIWKFEMLDRAIGSGDHVRPWWFYIPVFLAGLSPATMMLVLPVWNVTLRRCWDELRSGSFVALLVLAVVLPLIGFTLMAGKLPSYLLPVCAPMAVLNGMMLEVRLRPRAQLPDGFKRLPDVRITFTIVVIVLSLGALGAAIWFRPAFLLQVLPVLLVIGSALWLCRIWNARPDLRAFGLAMVWFTSLITWWSVYELEDAIQIQRDPARLVQRVRDLSRLQHPQVLTYGFTDPALSFYFDTEVVRLRPGNAAADLLNDQPGDVVVLVAADEWDQFQAQFPNATGQWVRAGTWQRNLASAAYILTPGRSEPPPPPPGAPAADESPAV